VPLLGDIAKSAVKPLLGNPAASVVDVTGKSQILSGIKLNKVVGDTIADVIAARYPAALREVPFNTVGGVRVVDIVTIGGHRLAIESKVGELRKRSYDGRLL
jgi:hypothetical protein